jgi:hypothetical protein
MISEPTTVELNAVRGLPVPRLDDVAADVPASTFYATTIDDRGRIGARSPLLDLMWAPGLHVFFGLRDGVVVVEPSQLGRRVGRRGHVRVPAGLRHRCRLGPGARVLVVADPQRNLMEIYPPAVVEVVLEMCRQRRR